MADHSRGAARFPLAAFAFAPLVLAMLSCVHSLCDRMRGRADNAGGVTMAAFPFPFSMGTSNPGRLWRGGSTKDGGGGNPNSPKMLVMESACCCCCVVLTKLQAGVAAAAEAAMAAAVASLLLASVGPLYRSVSHAGRSVTLVRMVARSRHRGMC